VRIDSFPDRVFGAHVETVATVASQQDFFSADVKVYTTKVAIDETVEGVKPGMTAEVTVTIADALEHVLTVPIQAIVGSVELGKKRKCFVLTPRGPEERDIVVGQSNVKMAEIKEGLQEGDEVVLNPKAIVGDKTKTRQPGVRRGEGDGSEPGVKSKGSSSGAKEKAKAPAAQPVQPAPGKPSGPGQVSPEERQKRQQEMTEKFRAASPEQRRQMLEEVPEAYRDKVRERLKAEGIELK
jgi:hypothetical protein